MKNRLPLNSEHLAIGILFLLFTLFSSDLKAQTDLINGLPEKVLVSFRTHHPEVSDVSWVREQNMFVAQYELKQTEHQLWMSDQGKVLKHAIAIQDEYLPAVVKEQLYKTFPSCRILSVHQVDIRNKNFYQIRIKNAHEKVDYFVDNNGNEVSGS